MTDAPALPFPGDQIIDAAMALALHADACRDHALVAWVVLWNLPGLPGKVCGEAGDVRPGALAVPDAGGHAGRYPGDATARPGAV